MKKSIAFVDDSFPVEGDVVIRSRQLGKLVKLSSKEWKSEVNLKELVQKVLATDRSRNKELELFGFLHPEKLLREITENDFNPDLIIYDWEYVKFSEESGENLIEILEKTEAFVFVYSSYFDAIYPTLNKSEFDKYSNRFQLLSKGDRHSSIFSSEEFILQYLLGLFSKDNIIQLSNRMIKFNSSGYLEDSSDILYLESILGREFILQNLSELGNEISEKKIELLFSLVNDKLFISNDKKYIVSDNNELMKERYGPFAEISYIGALELIGIKGIEKLLQSSIISIE